MATSWISCNACSTSDPTQDTVKVDPKLLNKENIQPLQTAAQREAVKASEEQRQREEARRRTDQAIAAAAAQAAQQHEEAERANVEKAYREELACREAEIATRHVALHHAAAEREDAARTAAAAQEERRREEVVEKQARLALKDAQEKVNAWCKQNGYQDMNTSKKTFRGGMKFPLHTAVKYSNQEIIRMMLLDGVNKDVRDSKNQTPCQLAAKVNNNGTHGEILTMLC